jgi:hypothetical protein
LNLERSGDEIPNAPAHPLRRDERGRQLSHFDDRQLGLWNAIVMSRDSAATIAIDIPLA